MPYTLVTPHYPPVCRPILLLPTVLGRVLNKKLAGWQGFHLCTPGKKPGNKSSTSLVPLELCGQERSDAEDLSHHHTMKQEVYLFVYEGRVKFIRDKQWPAFKLPFSYRYA